MILDATPPRRVEVYRFHSAAWILVPLAALILEVSLPIYVPSATVVDLPLLVVIYFALARRSPVPGLFVGALMGTAQDSLSRDPVGLFAIANTVAGYVTSAITSRMEAEAVGVRFILILFIYWLHLACIYALGAALLGESPGITFASGVIGALVNAGTGVLLFGLLDHFRMPA